MHKHCSNKFIDVSFYQKLSAQRIYLSQDKTVEKARSCVVIPGEMKMLHCDVLLSGQQQNHWLAKALPLQTLWTEWFQMSFEDMKVHCQREKNECRFSS